jgi:hypothetical protein
LSQEELELYPGWPQLRTVEFKKRFAMNALAENLQTAPMMPPPLVFTDNAAAKVKNLIDEEGNSDLKLRVFVQGGGCSGFQYGFTLMRLLTKTTLPWKKMVSAF